jgi:hypothetical protein
MHEEIALSVFVNRGRDGPHDGQFVRERRQLGDLLLIFSPLFPAGLNANGLAMTFPLLLN